MTDDRPGFYASRTIDTASFTIPADAYFKVSEVAYTDRQWISVADRLPEIARPCLVLCGTDYRGGPLCVVAEHEGGNRWSRDTGDMLEHEVTHWMPLPPAPKDQP